MIIPDPKSSSSHKCTSFLIKKLYLWKKISETWKLWRKKRDFYNVERSKNKILNWQIVILSVFALLSNMKNIFIIVKQEREGERLKIQLIYINRRKWKKKRRYLGNKSSLLMIKYNLNPNCNILGFVLFKYLPPKTGREMQANNVIIIRKWWQKL